MQIPVIAVGTPQSFRTTLARALEVEPDDLGWVQSVTAAEELLVESREPIDVLVLSPEVKDPDALGLAEFVGRTTPMTAIVAVRDTPWNGLLSAAMRAGIRDVVDLKQGTEEIRDAVERAITWADNLRHQRGLESVRSNHRGRIVSIFSSKGGAGKTFLTTNLATAISERSERDTAVVDLDVDMGDVFSYFGLESNKRISDLIALGEGADREEVLATGTRLGEHLYGFGAIADPAAESPGGEAVGKYLRALRSSFPYVVVDASADYTDIALACFDLSDTICLVSTLDVVGIKHLSKALDTLISIGLPRERFRIVLNRADKRLGLDPHDVQRVMKVDVDIMIPSSRAVPSALNKGRPVVLEDPGCDVSGSIHRLADRLIGTLPEQHEAEGLESAGANGKRRGRFRRR